MIIMTRWQSMVRLHMTDATLAFMMSTRMRGINFILGIHGLKDMVANMAVIGQFEPKLARHCWLMHRDNSLLVSYSILALSTQTGSRRLGITTPKDILLLMVRL